MLENLLYDLLKLLIPFYNFTSSLEMELIAQVNENDLILEILPLFSNFNLAVVKLISAVLESEDIPTNLKNDLKQDFADPTLLHPMEIRIQKNKYFQFIDYIDEILGEIQFFSQETQKFMALFLTWTGDFQKNRNDLEKIESLSKIYDSFVQKENEDDFEAKIIQLELEQDSNSFKDKNEKIGSAIMALMIEMRNFKKYFYDPE